MASGSYTEQILKDREFSLVHGITGTPTTFINDVRYAVSEVKLIAVVKAIVEKGTVLQKSYETNLGVA